MAEGYARDGHDTVGLAEALATIALAAAAAIMHQRAAGLDVRTKPDGSPVTTADDAAEAIILAGLAALLPGVSVVSEEAPIPETTAGTRFLLVDPLDGTREMLAGRDEFTVNIALIAASVPVLGVVVAPALRLLWLGGRRVPAMRFAVSADGTTDVLSARPLSTRRFRADHPVALVSRSHIDARSTSFLDRLGVVERQPCGSSLKLCRLAEGVADVYPRLAPIHEWDLAAGNAILLAAGGIIVDTEGEPLAYGRNGRDRILPPCIAWGDRVAALRHIATRSAPPA